MEIRVEAKTVDAVAIKPGPSSNGVQAASPTQSTLDGFVQLLELDDLEIIVPGILERTGFGTNYIDVDYEAGKVEVSSPNTTVVTDEPAFDRFMARLLSVAMAQAKKTAKPVTKLPWWATAEAGLKEIVKRAYPKGLPT